MLNKIIYTLIASTSLVSFLPSEAEAVKLKIEPSVTFRQSHNTVREVYPSRVPVRPVHVRSRPVIYRAYEPAPHRTYYTAVPRRDVVYYPDDYYHGYDESYSDGYYVYEAPEQVRYRTRTTGTDFGLTFKLK